MILNDALIHKIKKSNTSNKRKVIYRILRSSSTRMSFRSSGMKSMTYETLYHMAWCTKKTMCPMKNDFDALSSIKHFRFYFFPDMETTDNKIKAFWCTMARSMYACHIRIILYWKNNIGCIEIWLYKRNMVYKSC